MNRVTKKSIATISFNTEEFLKSRLNDLVKNESIVYYFYIMHKAEEDTKKAHFHVFIEPNGNIDVCKLRDFFNEPVLNNGDLGCLPFVNSKFEHWYLYSKHDIDYLNTRCEVKKYHYKKEDFIVSNEVQFEYLISTININIVNKKSQLINLCNQGYSWEDIILNSNLIPINQIKAYKEIYDICKMNLWKNEKERQEKEIESYFDEV